MEIISAVASATRSRGVAGLPALGEGLRGGGGVDCAQGSNSLGLGAGAVAVSEAPHLPQNESSSRTEAPQ
jgi:hypothetical protein